MADADPLVAKLAAIREDLRVTAELERAGGYEKPTLALAHAASLLAAADAVLALHVPYLSAGEGFCAHCGYDWPCKDRQAITAALTGKDAS